MKKLHWSIFAVFLLLTFSIRAQTPPHAKLYDDTGRLLADTAFKIPNGQLVKWKAIEDTLTNGIVARLVYPPVLLENGMNGKIILSFTVNKKGTFNDFRIEEYISYVSRDSMAFDVKMFAETCFGSTFFFSGNFARQGFKANKSQVERYYLPFDFEMNLHKMNRQIKNGWVTLENKIVPIRDDSENNR